MLTAVDRLVIGVANVAEAAETYRRLGFDVIHDEDTAEGLPQVACVVVGDFSLEFRATQDARLGGDSSGPGEADLRIVVRSDDLDAEVARLRSHGFGVSDPVDDPLEGLGGSLPRRSAVVHADIPLGLVEPGPAAERSLARGAVAHPNNATAVERIYVAVDAIERELDMFERLLGMPAPEPELGTVIMSLMSVFYLGGVGIAVAEPRGPGPTADALRSNGPGPFQVLFRADHLDRAAALMIDHGVPPPTRGTRLSGESALLVEPAHACNLYVAFAGRP